MSRRVPFAGQRVFYDASALYAATVRNDANHEDAVSTVALLSEHRSFPYSTNMAVAEFDALLVNRVNRDVAAEALRRIDRSASTIIVRVEPEDELRAREIIYGHSDRDYSLTDACSFAVMERLRIRYAFSFDRHFRQYGWAVFPER
jgi:predicted nucleic acid-binding protein